MARHVWKLTARNDEGVMNSAADRAFVRTLADRKARLASNRREIAVNNIIYIVGLVVVVIAVLSFFGLR